MKMKQAGKIPNKKSSCRGFSGRSFERKNHLLILCERNQPCAGPSGFRPAAHRNRRLDALAS